MFNIFKKKNNEAAIAKTKEAHRTYFREKLALNKDKNATFEAMYILFNELDIEMVELMHRYHLYIDFDYVEKDQYYEVMIQTINGGKKGMYTTVGTQDGENIMMLDSINDTISTDGMSSSDIISKVIDEINKFHRK